MIYTLEKIQVEKITADVEIARLTLTNLSQELVDHICCEVENLMGKGQSFEDAYSEVRAQAGIDVLKKIQENTLYLIDKNYSIMKTTMKITGNISLIFLSLGTLFKIFHLPGAGPFLVLGFFMLCFIFFPAAIYLNYREDDKKAVLMHVSILLGGMALMAGILFKVQHWPGAAMLMLTGWLLILLVFLPVLLFKNLKTAESGKQKGVYVLGVLSLVIFECGGMFKMFHWPGAGPLLITGSVLLIAFFLPAFSKLRLAAGKLSTGQYIYFVTISMYAIALTSLVALNVSGDVLGRFVNEEANAKSILHFYEVRINRVKSQASNDSLQLHIENIDNQANKIHDLIHNIKLDMIKAAEEVSTENAERMVNKPALIIRKDNNSVVNAELLEAGKAQQLQTMIAEFRRITGNTETELLLNTSGVNKNMEKTSWEYKTFNYKMLIAALATLTGIEKNVRMVEYRTIQHIN